MTLRANLLLLLSNLLIAVTRAAAEDVPFFQDRSVQFETAPELKGAQFKRMERDRNGIVYVLTDRGVARLFGDILALDRSFRPLTGKPVVDIAVAGGHLFYLFEDRIISNAHAGLVDLALPNGSRPEGFAVGSDGRVLLSSKTGCHWFDGSAWKPIQGDLGVVTKFYAFGSHFWMIEDGRVYQLQSDRFEKFGSVTDASALAFSGEGLLVATREGFLILDPLSAEVRQPRRSRLPVPQISTVEIAGKALWFGSEQGTYRVHFEDPTHPAIDYYASRRWLPDDQVIDLEALGNGDAYVLTRTGLAKIEFRRTTLLEKARYYDRKIRQRHIRFGFCAELRLPVPGDPTRAEMIDTDNDGTWSNYYMASQGFRFAVTGEKAALRNAWETFAALERLDSINPLPGFPSRTFERFGFKLSDPERWHATADGKWEWKAHTSSDEIAAHMFGCSVLYETSAQTAAQRDRITRFITGIVDHIIRNDWYLVDLDGRPTLWGRWNPEYVNAYPHTIVDRRLNSTEILAALQFAFHLSGNPTYKAKAEELIEQHGYLENAMSSMTRIRRTEGYHHEGYDMGDEWNHSDDLLAFVTYWVLHRYAFNDDLRRKFAKAVRDHWQIEKIERNPLWNFVYASTGAEQFDLPGALWTLRRFPIDLVQWRVQNSHRRDITLLEPNFRNQKSAELLPPDERRIMRWNGNPFVLDGGNGGYSELAGDEFLLPYWMGRYMGIIGKSKIENRSSKLKPEIKLERNPKNKTLNLNPTGTVMLEGHPLPFGIRSESSCQKKPTSGQVLGRKSTLE